MVDKREPQTRLHDWRYDPTKGDEWHGKNKLKWRCLNCGQEVVTPRHGSDPEPEGCEGAKKQPPSDDELAWEAKTEASCK